MTKQQEEIIKELNEFENKQILLNINTAIQSFLLGFIDGRKKSPKSETNLLEGDTMKFQNITIQQNKKCKTWYARFRKNGKQFYISAKTQKDCYDKLKEAIRTKNKIIKEKPPKKPTLEEWFNKWLELYKQNVKENTKNDYFKSFKYLNEIKNKQIDTIKSIEIIEILNTIKFERRKQIVWELLNMLFDKAIKNEIINKNPINNIDKPKHIKNNGLALTNEDETKLIKILEEKNLDMFLICLYQGLRRGEALALTFQDFDIENKSLTINKAINQFNKLDSTKNVYSTRIMPLFDNTIKIIQKYKNTNERLFPYSYNYAEQLFTTIIKNNFSKKYTLHSLRHTFITKCQEMNIPLHIIQKWVGHNLGSNITNKVYTHTRENAEIENIKKLNSN